MHANMIIVSVAHLMIDKVSDSSKRNMSRTVIFIEQNNKLIISIKEGKKNIKGGITGHRRKSSIEEPKRHSTNSSNSKDKKGITETKVDLIRMILDSIMKEWGKQRRSIGMISREDRMNLRNNLQEIHSTSHIILLRWWDNSYDDSSLLFLWYIRWNSFSAVLARKVRGLFISYHFDLNNNRSSNIRVYALAVRNGIFG